MDEHILWQISLSLQIKTVSICRESRVSFVLQIKCFSKNHMYDKKIWSQMAGYMNLPRVRLLEDRKFRKKKKKREENMKMEGWTWVWGEDTFKSSVKQQVSTSQQGGRILGNGLPLLLSRLSVLSCLPLFLPLSAVLLTALCCTEEKPRPAHPVSIHFTFVVKLSSRLKRSQIFSGCLTFHTLYFYTFVSRVANSDEEINEVWMYFWLCKSTFGSTILCQRFKCCKLFT